jgi:cytochrome c peroxidase
LYDIECLLRNKPFPFENKGEFLGRDDKKYFRVSILRNITKTAPYFHNGAIKDIKKVIELMAKHQVGVELTKSQIDDIHEFLKSLEGDIANYIF